MPEETIPQIKPGEEKEKPILDPIRINNQSQREEKPDPNKVRKSPRKKMLFGVLGFLLFFIVVLGLLFLNVYLKGRKALTSVYKVQESLKLQDIQKMKTDLGDFKTSLISLKSSYNLISWMKFIPFVGGYINDGKHFINAGIYGTDLGQITLDTIEPYSDLIGLKGAKTYGDGGKTAADRVDFIVKTLPSLLPKMDEIAAKADLVKNEIDDVNPKRYPEKIAGKPIRTTLEKGIDLVDSAAKLIINGKPLLKNTPYLLGLDSPRTYLILFQNDKELRPTGGFMTAYSIMKGDKAKFEPVSSNDIYNLDAKYKPQIVAPDPIVKYIKGPYILSKNLRLRDMNWSPDFSKSMDLFTKEAQSVGIKDIDGVIAVDTQVLVYLLDAIGPIGVPGFGNFSTQQIPDCNCPQVIYELESFADVEGPIVWVSVSGKIVYKPPNSDKRKKIIGPLMNSIMSNALGQPKEKIPALFEAGFKSMMEKHVLFFLFDKGTQEGVESFGIGGNIITQNNA